MKNFITALVLISFSMLNAQQISDYKYIVIPETFSDFKTNQYHLNTYLKNLLERKDYQILSENVQEWPAEAQQNTCSVLKADLKKGKSLLKNKLDVSFTDCQQKTIANLEGTSAVKEYDKGYQEAVKIAVQNVKNQNAKPIEQIKNSETPVEIVKYEEPKVNPSMQNSGIKAYSNGEIKLTKSDLTDGSFFLINESNSQIYAQFFPSSKNGVYRVKVTDPKGNYETIGFFDGNNLEIEINSDNNQKKLIQFKQL
ncbi:hypothetical protein [Moheibacter sediminis]|uniref:Uncharacterized protein n=1 Tax=Moheibacter sediminis TaxID=1434700 RepID=A0A1W2AUP5_9FLAO|nr:hypothetical protein [Moheibacter sediminis]SMC64416.1 hypothetical protein SAMN06296427_10588 [Moheibacter sediminis]